MNIDLNCDMGELAGDSHEAALMEFIHFRQHRLRRPRGR